MKQKKYKNIERNKIQTVFTSVHPWLKNKKKNLNLINYFLAQGSLKGN